MYENYGDVVTIDQAAEMLGVCRLTLYKMVKNGDLPYWRIGRRYKLKKSAIIAFIDDRSVKNGE